MQIFTGQLNKKSQGQNFREIHYTNIRGKNYSQNWGYSSYQSSRYSIESFGDSSSQSEEHLDARYASHNPKETKFENSQISAKEFLDSTYKRLMSNYQCKKNKIDFMKKQVKF
jgi:hypothetical protein